MALKKIISVIQSFSFFDTFQKISVYFSAQLAIQGLGIISLPVFTYFLTEAEYGIINVYGSLAIVFTVLLGANLTGAVSRYYYEKKEDFPVFLGTSMISTCFFFLIAATVLMFFKGSFSEWMNIPEQVIPWLIAYAFTAIIFNVFQQLFIARKSSKLVAITQVLNHYGKFAVAVIGFVLLTDDKYMGKVFGDLIGASLIGIFLLYRLSKFIKLKFSKAHFNYIINYSIPLIPILLSGYVLNFFDQFFINSTVGNEEAGLYSFAYKIGLLLSGFITALLSGANPDYFVWMEEKSIEKVNAQVVSLTKLLVLATGCLLLFGTDLGALLAAKASYQEALTIAPIIVLGFFFFGLAHLNNRIIYFSKRNIFLSIIVFIPGIVNIFLNYYFVPIYGYKVSAMTTLGSYGLMFLLSWIVTTMILKYEPLPFAKMAKSIIALMALVAIYFFLFSSLFSWTDLIFKGILF